MNKLSVMIWLSDVLPSIGATCLAICIIGAIAGGVITALGLFLNSTYDRDKEDFEKIRVRCVAAAWRIWPVVIVAAFIGIVMPSKSTVMAIAATEAASMALSSPDGKEITNDALAAVKSWLKSQIKEK